MGGTTLRVLCALILTLPSPSFSKSSEFFPAKGTQPFVTKPQGGQVQLYGISAALVVSISRYSAGQSGWPRLPATESEMNAVKDALVEQGFEVTRVYDPSAQELYTEMQSFLGRYGARQDARLLFFYSGHGFTNAQNQMAYIVPVDAANPKSDYSEFISKGVTLEYFHTWVRQFKAAHFIAIFDSCFSGAIFTTKSISDLPDSRPLGLDDRWQYLRSAAAKPVRQFISAGGPDEELPASSTFVPVFLEGIRGGSSNIKDGYITGKELGIFLERVVSTKRAGKQNPISGVSRDANFIFGDVIFQYDPKKSAIPSAASAYSGGVPSGVSNPSTPTTRGAHEPAPTTNRTGTKLAPTSEECRLFDCTKE